VRALSDLVGAPIDKDIAKTFGAMVLSTFIFDTLDSATRLGRYILQELFGVRSRVSGALATAATVGMPVLFLLGSGSGGFQKFWTLFGTSNQLLAALSLLAIAVWLRRSGKRSWFAAVPMGFVLIVTVVSLCLQVPNLWRSGVTSIAGINGAVSALLVALAASLVWYGARAMRRSTTPVP